MDSQTWRQTPLRQPTPSPSSPPSSFASDPTQPSQCAQSPRKPPTAAAAGASMPPPSQTPTSAPTGPRPPIRNIHAKLHQRRKGSAPDLDALRKRLSGASLPSLDAAHTSAPRDPQPALQSQQQQSHSPKTAAADDASLAMNVLECVSEFLKSRSSFARQCYDSASKRPMISVATLAELEIDSIVNNGRLRHDINFDRELHFRPNLDGSKGRDKMLQSHQYWTAVEVELEFCLHMLSHPNSQRLRWSSQWALEFRKALPRLPGMFISIREILDTLVPDEDQKRLHEILDIPFIMQEIERGSFDLQRLATTLSQLLTAHCAPMRDEWIEKMTETLRSGSESGNPARIVEGLKQLFAILEAMKLDVANHQIRFLRPRLLENTVPFEQNYFQRRIALEQLDMEKAYRWYCSRDTEVLHPLEDRISAFVLDATYVLFLQPHSVSAHTMMPETFKLDFDRIDLIQRSITHRIYTSICLSALGSLLEHLETPAFATQKALEKGRRLISTIIGSNSSASRWNAKLPNIAAELIRLVLADDLCKAGPAECADLANELEQWLHAHIEPGSGLLREKTEELREAVIELVMEFVNDNVSSSPHTLCEAMLGARTGSSQSGHGLQAAEMKKYFAPARPRPTLQGETVEEDVEELARRIAHILVLHWKVWAPILEKFERESAPPSPARSVSPSLCPSPQLEGAMLPIPAALPGPMEQDGEALNVGEDTEL